MENNNYLIHYGVIGMKWGVRRYQNYDGTRKKTATNDRSIGFNRTRHTNYEIKRARKIANAGRYKGGIYSGARALSGAMNIRSANMLGKYIARSTAVKVASLGGIQASKAAAIAAVGGTAVWAALMASSVYTVERLIATELYGRNETYREHIDRIASEELKVRD